MNIKDSLVSEYLANNLSKNDVVLIDVKPNQQTKNNLIVLKALSDINRWRGIVITLERPHHYLTYLLGIQGISQRNLTYIDLAYSKKKMIKFPVNVLDEENIIGGFINDEKIDLKDFDFLMVDNISSAKMYMRKESLINFITYLIEEAKKYELTLILPMDFSREREILGEIKDVANKEMSFEEVMKNAYQ